jgi:hypothetical protein
MLSGALHLSLVYPLYSIVHCDLSYPHMSAGTTYTEHEGATRVKLGKRAKATYRPRGVRRQTQKRMNRRRCQRLRPPLRGPRDAFESTPWTDPSALPNEKCYYLQCCCAQNCPGPSGTGFRIALPTNRGSPIQTSRHDPPPQLAGPGYLANDLPRHKKCQQVESHSSGPIIHRLGKAEQILVAVNHSSRKAGKSPDFCISTPCGASRVSSQRDE